MPDGVTVILMGPPGAGKGTQAQLLHDRLSFSIVEAGELLREKAKEQSPVGKKIAEIQARGELLTDDIVSSVIGAELERVDRTHGLVIDGYPRTIESAVSLDLFIVKLRLQPVKVVHLSLPDDQASIRISHRRICSSCGRIYPDPEKKNCQVCGGSLVARSDANPDAIQRRIDAYHRQVLPTVERYRKTYDFLDADGTRPIEEVYELIVTFIRS